MLSTVAKCKKLGQHPCLKGVLTIKEENKNNQGNIPNKRPERT